jgi:hypothetical protein
MNVCPACERDVRPLWPTCRSCGALLMVPPEPVAAVAATATTARGAVSAEEQFFAPAVLQPIVQLPPAATAPPKTGASSGSGAGKWLALVAVTVFVIAAVATAWFTFKGAGTKPELPVALAPRTPTAGLPTSLPAIVRIQAESTRHTALQAVEQVGSGDPAALAAMQPDYTWLAGDRPSTDAHDVSVAQNAGVVTIAVAASNHDVCAFGQWWPGGTAQYVTMEHQPTCAAIDAPTTGWSTEAGGAASDLPDDNG